MYALGGTFIGWLGYGVAFMWFAQGLLPEGSRAAVNNYVATWAGSYLAGFLTVLPPAGLGVADAMMVRLAPVFGIASGAQAGLLAIGVRVWRTVMEIVPGALALLVPVDRQAPEPPPPSRGSRMP
jgi:hypothetical protein